MRPSKRLVRSTVTVADEASGGSWADVGCLWVEGPVWPMLVVLLDVVGDESFELAADPDDGAIEKLSSDSLPHDV
jgi:hypothetical protein